MNNKQRETLANIFQRPTRKDVRWNDVESLLYALGAEITQGRGSRVRVKLNDKRLHLHAPHPDPNMVAGAVEDVRRFLEELGVTP